MSENSQYVYILRCADGSLYTGYTNDLSKRIRIHNEKKGAKYTKSRLPVKLEFYYVFSTKTEALKAEYMIKKLPKSKKEEIIKYPENFSNLYFKFQESKKDPD